MGTLPFSLSVDAAAFIERCLQLASNQPDVAELVPVLDICYGFEQRDPQGKVVAKFVGEEVNIGWYSPEQMARVSFPSVELCGETVFIPPETLDRLTEKTLQVETIEIGYPTASNVKKQLLRAV
jgi:hypothetical protein